MPSEFNYAICELKGNIQNMYESKFLNFEPSEEAEWGEVHDGFIEVKELINQYNGENPEYDISGNVGEELDTIQFCIDDNNVDNYNHAFDALTLIKDFLVEKCEEFTLYYQELITEADDLFDSEDYENALTKYQEAIELNPNDSYPQNRIDEINGILSDIEDTYNTLISEADALFDGEDYQNAKIKYQEALDTKPNESYPATRINEIDSILANQALYDSLIAEADALFSSEAYENAKLKYQEALAIFPDETYPVEKIEEINTLLEQHNDSEQPRVYSSPFPKSFSSIFSWPTNTFKF